MISFLGWVFCQSTWLSDIPGCSSLGAHHKPVVGQVGIWMHANRGAWTLQAGGFRQTGYSAFGCAMRWELVLDDVFITAIQLNDTFG